MSVLSLSLRNAFPTKYCSWTPTLSLFEDIRMHIYDLTVMSLYIRVIELVNFIQYNTGTKFLNLRKKLQIISNLYQGRKCKIYKYFFRNHFLLYCYSKFYLNRFGKKKLRSFR